MQKEKMEKSQKRRREMGKMSAVLLLKAEARGPLPLSPSLCLLVLLSAVLNEIL